MRSDGGTSSPSNVAAVIPERLCGAGIQKNSAIVRRLASSGSQLLSLLSLDREANKSAPMRAMRTFRARIMCPYVWHSASGPPTQSCFDKYRATELGRRANAYRGLQ